MNYKDANKAIADAVAAIIAAREEYAEAVNTANDDETLSDYGRKLARDEAFDKMTEAIKDAPEVIETAAKIINEAADSFNTAFDFKSSSLRDAVAFAQYPDLPDVAVTAMLEGIKHPSEARYIARVLDKSGNGKGAMTASKLADSLTAGHVNNPTDAWFIANETGTGYDARNLRRITSEAQGIADLMGSADQGAQESAAAE